MQPGYCDSSDVGSEGDAGVVTTAQVVRLRHVMAQATEYGLQQYGDPINVDVELAEGERIIGFESWHTTGGFDELAMMVRVWIEVPT